MKTTLFNPTLALLSFMVSSLVISCSSNEFHRIEDGYDREEVLGHGMDIDMSEFLDITSTNHRTMIQSDFETLHKAITRIEKFYDDDFFVLDNNALNMSDSLYLLACKIIHNTNNLFSPCNSKIKRVKNSNRESSFTISGSDCVGQAIARKFSLNVDSINTILANKYPTYNTQGVPYGKLEEAFDECGLNYTKGTIVNGTGSYNILIIKPTSSNDYHAMNIISSGIGADMDYFIEAMDKNNDEVMFTLSSRYLPRNCVSHLGITIDKYYIVSQKQN